MTAFVHHRVSCGSVWWVWHYLLCFSKSYNKYRYGYSCRIPYCLCAHHSIASLAALSSMLSEHEANNVINMIGKIIFFISFFLIFVLYRIYPFNSFIHKYNMLFGIWIVLNFGHKDKFFWWNSKVICYVFVGKIHQIKLFLILFSFFSVFCCTFVFQNIISSKV